MVRFVTARTVPLPFDRVWASWVPFSREAVAGDPSALERTVEQVGDHQTRLVTRGTTRAGKVRIDSVLTYEGDRDWSVRSETELNGRPFGRESTHFHVEPLEESSVVTVSYEVQGRTMFVDLMLWLGTGRLRKQREKLLDAWVRSMGPSGTARSVPGGPGVPP